MCIKFFKKNVEIGATGCIPSPEDSRDIKLSAVQASIPLKNLPENFSIPYSLPILNQNGFPACVGFACASLKGEKERREQNVMDFDGKWIYDEAKKIDNMPNIEGTCLRTGMKILKDEGAKPLNDAETEANTYKIGGYASVDCTFDELKKAIYQNGVIIAGFRGSNPGWQTGYIRPPKAGEKEWGHAVALVGYNKDYIIGQNSWGANWGDQGMFYIPPTYLPFESWACLVDLPNDFVQVDKPKYTFTKELNPGDKNHDVKMLQTCLKFLGVFPLIIECTGYYGMITEQAVKTFQLSNNLQATGIMGPQTKALLNSLFS